MNNDFAPLRDALRPLAEIAVPWSVAGGWALDLFLGAVTREHQDVDVAVLRRDFSALRTAMPAWTFQRAFVGEPGRLSDLAPDEELVLPEHELVATRPADGAQLEFLLNEAVGSVWTFRRDPSITLAWRYARLISAQGIPHLAPEIVLLYKAKSPRPRDTADFEALGPRLGERRRRWLREAIAIAHPDCPWHF